MHAIKFQITDFSSAVTCSDITSSFSKLVSQIHCQCSIKTKPHLPTPQVSNKSPLLSGGVGEDKEKHNLINFENEAFPCPRRIYLAVEGLDTNLACLSGGLCFCGKITAMHDLLVVGVFFVSCLDLMAAPTFCLSELVFTCLTSNCFTVQMSCFKASTCACDIRGRASV